MIRNSFQINQRLCCALTFRSRGLWNRNTTVATAPAAPSRTLWTSTSRNVFVQKIRTVQRQFLRGKKDDGNLSALFKPVPVRSNPDDISIGAELTGKLDKGELLKVLNRFTQKRETKLLCTENGLDSN